MILPSREIEPVIARCWADPDQVITDDAAQTIASWWHSPAPIDEQVTRLSHGLEFDARGLLTRVDTLIRDTSADADRHPDLVVLRRWVLDRLPHLAVTTFEMSAAEWEAWSQQWGHTGTDQPADLTGHTEEHLVADSAEDLGEWVYPGDTRYPADTPGLDNDIDVDSEDGGLWLPLPAVDTVAAMLTGHITRFWAESYGSNPFASSPYWGQSSTFAAQGAHQPYASRYIHPYTGDVEITLARVHGFSTGEQAEIHRRWNAGGR
ncbi:hypothetical protein [Actinophytocola xanthii]|uniref:Uncharacterized protein n=1 Tax=Actinophytocola xanthii TaxID=1912961 RepID=A0A1Q8C2H9_9PSEU|nr:hypothetical protein [Actinophytocola xanthii]OLF08568.1 hypothetical protein BU204_34310 [Actinophytocola xanthii]